MFWELVWLVFISVKAECSLQLLGTALKIHKNARSCLFWALMGFKNQSGTWCKVASIQYIFRFLTRCQTDLHSFYVHLRCLLAALTAHAAKTQPSLKAVQLSVYKAITLLLPLSCVYFVSEMACKVLCSSHRSHVLLQLDASRLNYNACVHLLLSSWIDVLRCARFQALVQDRVKPKAAVVCWFKFHLSYLFSRAVDALLIWLNCAAPMMHQLARSRRPPSRPGTISSGTEINKLK